MTSRILQRLGVVTLVVGTLVAASGVRAQASLPYTPSAAGRHAIELLVDDGAMQLTTTAWPLPLRAVRQALAGLPAAVARPDIEAARALVSAELDAYERGRLSVNLVRRADTLVGFGDDASPASSLRLRGDVLATDTFHAARIGVRLDADSGPPGVPQRGGARARLDDSAIAFEALGVQLQASTRSAWWGPGWRSSLILGNNIPDLAAVSLQRASGGRSQSPWLSWLGPWNLEFFAAQSETQSSEPAYSWLVGQRLTARPFDGWEIGLSRTAQWGGRGRPETGRSFWQMLSGKGLNPNTPQEGDVANELAGFDVRARCPAGWPCAVYIQLIGEDLSHGLPSHYLSQYGIEVWRDSSRFNLEFADSTCDSTPLDSQRKNGCAYRNHVYVNGYVSSGRWIGASQGPDARLLSLGWQDVDSRVRVQVDYGLLAEHPAAPLVDFYDQVPGAYPDGHVAALAVQRSVNWMGGDLTPQLRWQQVSVGGARNRALSVGAQWSTAFDGRSRPSATGAWAGEHPVPTALALLALGVALDRPADRYAQDHGANPSMKALRKVGDALPTVALGLAGTQWLFERGSAAGDTALAATTAGLGAYAGSKLLKTAISRDRPTEGLGPDSFGQSGSPRSDSSMPSNHAAIAWAVLTPYAQTYGQDWLYGLAGLTSFGRVMGREHWASDAIAGSLIGYHLGSWARTSLGNGASLSLVGRGVALSMPLP